MTAANPFAPPALPEAPNALATPAPPGLVRWWAAAAAFGAPGLAWGIAWASVTWLAAPLEAGAYVLAAIVFSVLCVTACALGGAVTWVPMRRRAIRGWVCGAVSGLVAVLALTAPIAALFLLALPDRTDAAMLVGTIALSTMLGAAASAFVVPGAVIVGVALGRLEDAAAER